MYTVFENMFYTIDPEPVVQDVKPANKRKEININIRIKKKNVVPLLPIIYELGPGTPQQTI